MIITYEDLINILDLVATPTSSTGSPRDAFAINFVNKAQSKHKETIDFDTVDNRTLLLDIDEEGRVTSIEIF